MVVDLGRGGGRAALTLLIGLLAVGTIYRKNDTTPPRRAFPRRH
ncbi:hypothetical protein I552_4886 [Mycobacterium xenopi 3993]|nr:hypothetical protein I552_4886 [Mycobacterium xenopi 3993]